MGFPVLCVFLLSSLLSLYWVQSQDLREQDALCREDGCFVIHFQRKIFLDAWRSCKEQDGNLAIIRNSRDAEMVEELFANVELRPNHRGKANIWIGLQRQPRQCSPNRQLRGFSWVTGDQDTEFTNWLQEDSSGACSTPRCVVMPYNTAADEKGDNLKWKDGPCSISVDGYLCWYNFRGMCKAIGSEGGGNTFYSTPFNLLSTVLTYVPFGSVATVPCPAKEDQSVLCTQKDDGAVAWNRDPPFCSNTPKTSLCDQDNGGCHHICIETSLHYYCDCSVGYLLAEDGASCFPSDPCNDAPCEFECLPVMDGYRCACPDGYMLAPDERSCVDVDECLQSPCEHICENSPGTFECHCRDGYRQDQEGACEDVDECADNPCEHACENTIGSHICHCHLGFAPLEEDQSRCHDIDECQIEGTCEQMCINYLGGFECYCEEGYNLQPDQYACRPVEDDFELATTPVFSPFVTDNPVWEPEHSEKPWQFPSESDWRIPLSWTTQLPSVETVQTDPTWSFEEEPDTTQSPEIINVDTNPEQPVHSSIFSPTIPLSTPDYYEDESTTVPPDPPSSTALGGAWNWLWFSSVQPETQETANRPLDFPGDDDSYDPDYVSNQWYNDKPTTFGPDLQTSTLQSQAVQEVLLNDENTSGENHGTSWLLVGLLVPLCIFVVVMVVLGIIYCTRYTVKPQEKTTSDCYHWIAGAGDKAAADISGPKTNV